MRGGGRHNIMVPVNGPQPGPAFAEPASAFAGAIAMAEDSAGRYCACRAQNTRVCFLAQRAIVCSHGRQPVENGRPQPQSPRRGAASEGGATNEDVRRDGRDSAPPRKGGVTTRTRGNVAHQPKTIFRCRTLARAARVIWRRLVSAGCYDK